MEQPVNYATRKIQLTINHPDVEFKKSMYAKLYEWQWICFKGANQIITHHYIQEQLKDLIYITDDVKVKLANIRKDEDGILTTSKENSTYQLLSKYYKGSVPMNIMATLNHDLVKDYYADRKDYWSGTKSLRSYKRNIPLPFPAKELKLKPMESGKAYQFTLYQIPFKTYLGKDRSDKAVLIKRYLAGSIRLCTCTLKLEKNKIFLMATFQMERQAHQLDDAVIAEASLSLEHPITVKIGNIEHLIGNKEEFLHRRVALQNARRRLQLGATFNRSGKGRKRKTKCVDKYQDQEQRYVDYKLHVYSRQLIDYCIKNKAGTLLLVNQEQKEEAAKNDPFLLRNWSYHGLKEKIAYKANIAGITLISD